MKCSRSQQSDFTKRTIRTAKKMIDNGADYKTVSNFIKTEFEKEAENNFGFFDSVQYNKAIDSVIKYL